MLRAAATAGPVATAASRSGPARVLRHPGDQHSRNGVQTAYRKGLYIRRTSTILPSDLFIMGSASYTIVTFSGTSTTFKTANYKGTGSPEGRPSVGSTATPSTTWPSCFPAASALRSSPARPPTPSGRCCRSFPKALAIGDFDGSGKNDLAIARRHRRADAVLRYWPRWFRRHSHPLATPGTGLSTLMMATVRDVTQDGTDELVLALYDNSASMSHRLQS